MSRKLKIVLGPHGQVADLRSGVVPVEGLDLDFIEVKRMPDAYRDMARSQPYDICELAPTTYLMALAAGAPITALPIPMTRRFRHRGLLKRKDDAAIAGPKDLEGRRVGVRTYSVTAAVWTRGVFAEDYGLDLGSITWMVAEDDNDASFVPPKNVGKIGAGETIAGLMREGALAAAFDGLAGIGGHNDGEFVDVVSDAAAREVDWYRRTRIYPIHGVIALRNDVIEADPDIGRRLFAAFSEAKANYWARVESGAADGAEDQRYRKLAALVGDPLPYGLDENAETLEALVRFTRDQGLVRDGAAASIATLFPDPRDPKAPPLAAWS
ncbi:MAG TPA: ABC transporter substrate-binding protein [Hyphomicrobiales bacterium]|nr:ABC transporter substrate-binding protein [Hyphomicrobiales bacterium]